MELSEGKLFTIEALNRIEGFEWPNGANWARLDGVVSDKVIHFFSDDTWIKSVNYYIDNHNGFGVHTGINRAEFESVDGWVRNDGKSIHDLSGKAVIEYIKRNESVYWEQAEFIDLTHTGNNGDIMKWRYCKKENKDEQPATQPDAGIETLISQHKAATQSTLEARRLLEHAEAIEHNLLLSIEAWAESNGFDIRVLDESEENPELVITDWRYLRVGDVIDFTSCGLTSAEWRVSFTDGYIVLRKGSYGIYRVNEENDTFKFVSRPAKVEK